MLRKLSFGQYKYKNSFVHGLDPRLKLIYVFILSILAFSVNNISEILIFSLFAVAVILLSKLDLKALIKGLRPFFFIFAFIILMYISFSRDNLWQGVVSVWRFLMLIIIALILTYTTTISSITTAIEKLAKLLKILGIKPRNIAVMISITIRFVPMMFINLESLRAAMLARLADFRRLKNIKLLMLTLLSRMFKSASNLSDAMQSRLYDENAESRKNLKAKLQDYVSAIFIFILAYIFIY